MHSSRMRTVHSSGRISGGQWGGVSAPGGFMSAPRLGQGLHRGAMSARGGRVYAMGGMSVPGGHVCSQGGSAPRGCVCSQ